MSFRIIGLKIYRTIFEIFITMSYTKRFTKIVSFVMLFLIFPRILPNGVYLILIFTGPIYNYPSYEVI